MNRVKIVDSYGDHVSVYNSPNTIDANEIMSIETEDHLIFLGVQNVRDVMAVCLAALNSIKDKESE